MESAAAEPKLRANAIARALHGAFCRGVSSQELLQLACTKIRQSGAPYSHVYIYSLQTDSSLALEAYSGHSPEIGRINAPAGPRVTAVIQKHNRYIAQISQHGTNQTHSSDTESALIVLIRRHDEIIGEIDIESDRPDAFDETEQAAVVAVADALAALL